MMKTTVLLLSSLALMGCNDDQANKQSSPAKAERIVATQGQTDRAMAVIKETCPGAAEIINAGEDRTVMPSWNFGNGKFERSLLKKRGFDATFEIPFDQLRMEVGFQYFILGLIKAPNSPKETVQVFAQGKIAQAACGIPESEGLVPVQTVSARVLHD